MLQDSLAALEHLRSPEMRDTLRVDPTNVALVGHSMGGWASLMTAARIKVLGAASIAGFNLGAVARRVGDDPSYAGALREIFEPQMAPLKEATADRLFAEAVQAGHSWDVCAHAEPLRGRPVLLLAASDDDEVPVDMHHQPMVEALSGAGARLTHRVFETDHAFSDRRVELAETVAGWLSGLPRAAPSVRGPGGA